LKKLPPFFWLDSATFAIAHGKYRVFCEPSAFASGGRFSCAFLAKSPTRASSAHQSGTVERIYPGLPTGGSLPFTPNRLFCSIAMWQQFALSLKYDTICGAERGQVESASHNKAFAIRRFMTGFVKNSFFSAEGRRDLEVL